MPGRAPRPALAVGIDAGGTWIRAAVVDHGRVRRRARVPAPRFLASRPVQTLVRSLLEARTPPASLVVAARGVWTHAERVRLRHRLRGLARRVRVISDAEAAFHGALDAAPGILILAGTGSIVIGRDARGRWARAGGLGPLLGDEGSAFGLGRAWLRGATRASDMLKARRLVRAPDAVRRIAALAPTVLQRARQGDRRALAIVREAQDDLAELATRVAGSLGLRPPVAVSWAGSLMNEPWFRRGVRRALGGRRLAMRWVAPAASPVDGAARLAARLAGPPGRHGRSGAEAAAPGPGRARTAGNARR